MHFSEDLITWYSNNKRNLPWRSINDPYCIWLSEIVLQQTRVAQGKAYYERLVEHFPTVKHLAEAPEDQVMKLWQGLGYYSRARNLHAAAKQVMNEFEGVFPDTYNNIKKLKGVGDYTAAAIASFAFGLPHAVVDGNVYRVLSRVFGIDTPIDTTQGKKEFATLAQELLHTKKPDIYNQAIMEFGAIQCQPKSPACHSCPFASSCVALEKGTVETLPVKSKKVKQRDRFFTYIVPKDDKYTFIKKRTDPKDIWQNLYEFPLLETPKELNTTELSDHLHQFFGCGSVVEHISEKVKHVLSHQRLWTRFVVVKTEKPELLTDKGFKRVEVGNLGDFAFPRLIDRFLENARQDMFPIL